MLADSIEEMSSGKGRARHRTLTTETKAALVNTLRAVTELCEELLTVPNVAYVLLAELQSDPLEAEFGVYRQMSGGNYFICVEQVLLSARLRRMKLYSVLQLDGFVHSTGSCCTSPLTDDELGTLDNCYEKMDHLSMSETASLYYISGKYFSPFWGFF